MFKKTLQLGLLILSVSTLGFIGSVHAAVDQLSSLITKVNNQSKSDEISAGESRMLGRASWKIKCQYKAFDDMKACVMSKGPISVLHLNNQYIKPLAKVKNRLY